MHLLTCDGVKVYDTWWWWWWWLDHGDWTWGGLEALWAVYVGLEGDIYLKMIKHNTSIFIQFALKNNIYNRMTIIQQDYFQLSVNTIYTNTIERNQVQSIRPDIYIDSELSSRAATWITSEVLTEIAIVIRKLWRICFWLKVISIGIGKPPIVFKFIKHTFAVVS